MGSATLSAAIPLNTQTAAITILTIILLLLIFLFEAAFTSKLSIRVSISQYCANIPQASLGLNSILITCFCDGGMMPDVAFIIKTLYDDLYMQVDCCIFICKTCSLVVANAESLSEKSFTRINAGPVENDFHLT